MVSQYFLPLSLDSRGLLPELAGILPERVDLYGGDDIPGDEEAEYEKCQG